MLLLQLCLEFSPPSEWNEEVTLTRESLHLVLKDEKIEDCEHKKEMLDKKYGVVVKK